MVMMAMIFFMVAIVSVVVLGANISPKMNIFCYVMLLVSVSTCGVLAIEAALVKEEKNE